jgi:hypothetical protein
MHQEPSGVWIMAYTTIDNPELYFQTKLYAGNGSSQSITFDGSENMQPDWVWIKSRTDTRKHNLYDSVRGTNKRLVSNATSAEDEPDSNAGVNAFNSDGFTVGSETDVNGSSRNFVSWNWLAGGSASSNSDGSITSSVSASTTAGFSIVSYTGTGSNATIGHGLNSSPKMVIVKDRDNSSYAWHVYHVGVGATKTIYLNLSNTPDTNSIYWNNTTPTSSVFSVGTSVTTNNSGDKFIAYCFADVKGYSKFGSYTGNGTSGNGAFIYTGFSPAFVIYKNANATYHWGMFDNKRNSFNVVDDLLFPNLNNAEQTGGRKIDMLSNGFKVRATDDISDINGSGNTIIYMAFAESPFVNSKGVPNNAR